MKTLLYKLLTWLGLRKKEEPTIYWADLDERDKSIRALYANDEVEKVVCNNCGELVNKDEIVNCLLCNASGCKNCFTYDPKSDKYYCDSCW